MLCLANEHFVRDCHSHLDHFVLRLPTFCAPLNYFFELFFVLGTSCLSYFSTLNYSLSYFWEFLLSAMCPQLGSFFIKLPLIKTPETKRNTMATKKTRSNKSKVKICSCHTAAPQPNDFPRLFKLMQIQMSQEPRFALLLCHSWVPEVLFTGLLSRRWMLRFESLCCLGDVAWHRAAEKLLFHGGFLMRRQAMRWCFRVCTWMNLRF